MAIKITITSTKGGVGKTTLTANLAGLLADLGQRVLAVDADIQPTLSSFYHIQSRAPAGLMALISEARTEGVISTSTIPGLDIVLSDDPGGALQNWILHQPDGRVRLRHLLSGLDDAYDIILIDTQGAVGPLQDAAVLAADLLLSPIPPEILSAREFARGTLGMLHRLQPMAFLGAPVGPLKGVIYRMDHTRDARMIARELRQESYAPSRGAIDILDTIVPSTVAYREAATHRMPVHRWEARRSGPTASALDTMTQLVHELFPHLSDLTPSWGSEKPSIPHDKEGHS
ncbi:chromosome partitioning protein [Ectothiorhodospira shaposhnikovii]|uniref:ParA family protein n=1 Tax=Ectothiorhodospira shaposhnikovii TaxID=1054 RepID=UPI001905C499|nr:ParA family protein [Ectothiorhodospira shaposhnikovii]MBK1672856.1 chromosome partitioning protein [Ectothiorhodospira shaposhnikovii]